MARYRFRRDVRYRRILGEAVVIRQDASEVMGINEVGARILDGIRDGHDGDAIAERLVAELEVSPEVAASDLASFLLEMEAAGVVEAVEDGSSPGVG